MTFALATLSAVPMCTVRLLVVYPGYTGVTCSV